MEKTKCCNSKFLIMLRPDWGEILEVVGVSSELSSKQYLFCWLNAKNDDTATNKSYRLELCHESLVRLYDRHRQSHVRQLSKDLITYSCTY